ncbi:MAG TPA: hypothetical protein VKG78_06975 [Opitutaceae bacterium]|nr:hypothetical protein [Opitutaceae bacterium]
MSATKARLLDGIRGHADVKALAPKDLSRLALEIRGERVEADV